MDFKWWPGRVGPVAAFAEKLDEGAAPTSDLVLVPVSKALELRGIAQAHGLQTKAALVLTDVSADAAPRDLNTEKRWVRTAEGKWLQVLVAPLATELPVWGLQPDVVICKNVPKAEELSTCRVVMPREFQAVADWDLACRKPVALIKSQLPQGLVVKAYGWHRLEAKQAKDEAVVGFVKIPTKDVHLITQGSGLKGVFWKLLGDKAQKPVKWIPNPEKLKAHAYYAMAKRQAEAQHVGLAFRSGGGANLGLVGVANVTEGGETVKRRWVAKGVPADWAPAQLLTLLESEMWRVISGIQPPSHPKGPWSFHAAPPNSPMGDQWMLQLGDDGGTILIRPFQKPAPKAVSQPLKSSAGWFSRPLEKTEPKQDAPAQPSKQADKASADAPAAATQVDPLTQKFGPHLDATNDEDMTGGKRGDKRTSQESPSKDKPPKAPKVPEDTPDLGPDKVPRWDLKGSGDCGFRCLAAGNCLKHKKPPEEIVPKIAQLSLSLRTKAVSWLEQNQGAWVLEWFQDPECSEQTEGGPVPKDAAEYLAACRRPGKWLDPWLAVACAHVLQAEIMVFKMVRGKWVFLERIVPRVKASSSPLLLFLQNGHFTTLEAGVQHPSRWAGLGWDPPAGMSQSYLGGGGSESDLSLLLRPAHESVAPSPPRPRLEEKGSEVSLLLRPARKRKTSNSEISRLLGPPPSGASAGSKRAKQSKPQLSSASNADALGSSASVGPLMRGSATKARSLGQVARAESPAPVPHGKWRCPVQGCNLLVPVGSKFHHFRTRHPDLDKDMIMIDRPVIVVASSEIPPSQREWTCPVPGCDKGLPVLTSQDKKRAIKEHCRSCHPHVVAVTLKKRPPPWLTLLAKASPRKVLLTISVESMLRIEVLILPHTTLSRFRRLSVTTKETEVLCTTVAGASLFSEVGKISGRVMSGSKALKTTPMLGAGVDVGGCASKPRSRSTLGPCWLRSVNR